MNFRIIEQYSNVLVDAAVFTLAVSILSILGSLLPGFIFAMMTRSQQAVVRALGHFLIALGRNIPSILQLFIVYYVFPIAFDISISAFWSAVAAFAFNGSGYVAAIVQSGLRGVPKGQWEAGRALGFRGVVLYGRIVGPQAVTLLTAPIMNEVSRQIKSSSIAAAVAVPELIYQATSISSRTFDPLTVMTAVAMIYFIIIFPLGLISRRIGTKRGERV